MKVLIDNPKNIRHADIATIILIQDETDGISNALQALNAGLATYFPDKKSVIIGAHRSKKQRPAY